MNSTIAIDNPVRTQAIVNRYFVKAKKNLGQNFLVDHQAVMGIIEAAEIEAGDQVIEIGPGIGSLTENCYWLELRYLLMKLMILCQKF